MAQKYYSGKFKPTVYEANPFDANEDAAVLRKAMTGCGTDEQAIIDVITNRSMTQRLEIVTVYKSLYGEDLVDYLRSKLSGNFKEVIVGLMISLPEYYAKELHDGMEELRAAEEALIEILCTLSNYGIKTVCAFYEKLYGKSFESDIIAHTSGYFKRLLVSLSQGNRDESSTIDIEEAQADAQALYDGGDKIWGNDQCLFNIILVTRNYQQLRQIFTEYEKLTRYDFEKAIKKEYFGDIKNGLLAIVSCVKSKNKFFASRLCYSMKGLGMDDRTLIRIIVARSEIDLGNIKEAFEDEYESSLEEWIINDTFGNYKKALLSIVST